MLDNLSINKIIYFLHAYYLVQFGRPLVSAKIEAWKLGPVFREVYHSFKGFGDNPITTQATRIDAGTGLSEVCIAVLSHEEESFLRKVAAEYVRLSASQLVTLSHEKGGPWDRVWNHQGRVNSSMRISDEVVLNWYRQSLRH
ncbi:Panacea domain-containing protein [Methyloferula stellata]|uniref:Panacea domain-containing protein n=1 Tax=Methyloferula stellata TaxID=876270 RepID=UPI001FCCB7A7|nr:type II toxin-antitoxin system antitoxin SocA domain-containing protein [Methyloferula stellata]